MAEKQVTRHTKLKKNAARLKPSGERLKPGDSWRATVPTANARGYTYEWQKARAAYLLEHPLCIHCERVGVVTAATVVNHVVPHEGDPVKFWDQSNWEPSCVTHHSRDIQRAEHAEKYGRSK